MGCDRRLILQLSKVCGNSTKKDQSRGPCPARQSWWWNEEVELTICTKAAYCKWQEDWNGVNWIEYRRVKIETKCKVALVSTTSSRISITSQGLQSKKEIYQPAKVREQRGQRYSQGVVSEKDKDDRMLIDPKQVKRSQEQPFQALLNSGATESDDHLEGEGGSMNRIVRQGFIRPSKQCNPRRQWALTASLQKYGRQQGKRTLDGLGYSLIKWLRRIKCQTSGERWRPQSLRRKVIFQNCRNYRGFKLMSHTINLWGRLVDRHIWAVTTIRVNKLGHRSGHFTMESIFSVRQMVEKLRAAKRSLRLGFDDVEKAYDLSPQAQHVGCNEITWSKCKLYQDIEGQVPWFRDQCKDIYGDY